MRGKQFKGQRFGRLLVIKDSKNRTKWNDIIWDCLCDCGNNTKVISSRLQNGRTKSCGCLHKEISSGFLKTRNTTHGMHNNSTYRTWRAMKERCNNLNVKYYRNYGGRGITYNPNWELFENFFKDMGNRPKGKTLDRKDNDGIYCKENCKWSTPQEQANNRRDNKKPTRVI